MYDRLHRPHLPWSVPQKFFDLYNESELALAQHEVAPRGMPPIAWHSCSREEDGCFTNGCIPKATDAPTHPATPEQQRRTRHGYYAAVSYADDRVGRVLSLLNSTKQLHDSTLVVVHGDVSADERRALPPYARSARAFHRELLPLAYIYYYIIIIYYYIYASSLPTARTHVRMVLADGST